MSRRLEKLRFPSCFGIGMSPVPGLLLLLLLLLLDSVPLFGRDKDKLPYGEGLVVNIPMAESEVETVVSDVVQNGVIRGTKEYNKDEYVAGAKAASTSSVFPDWGEGGKVFYKVREQAIDPRNFKDSGDVGTLVVRYILQPQGEKNTVLRIDALFKEEYRHTVHPSNGSVESAEFKDIQEHLEAIEVMKKQNLESEAERQEQRLKKQRAIQAEVFPPQAPPDAPSTEQSNAATGASAVATPPAQTPPPASSPQSVVDVQPAQPEPAPVDQAPPGQTLEEHVKDLRKQVERLVKAPGAPLKSAPFHTASTLQTLSTGTEVLILITTPYWYGIETHEGQHGWVSRGQLEQP